MAGELVLVVDGDGLLEFVLEEVGGGVLDSVLGGAPEGEAGTLELGLLRRGTVG